MFSNTLEQEKNPFVSVDCVIFGFDFQKLNVLLISRSATGKEGDDKLLYALPGDLISNKEHLKDSAKRILNELTNLDDIFLEQFGAFGRLDRLDDNREWLKNVRHKPNERVVTIGYCALVNMDDYNPSGASFAVDAKWYPVSELPGLVFDHNKIFDEGLDFLKSKLSKYPVGANLLPEKFTLGQLQKLYEAILGVELDKRNFRRKISNLGFLEPLGEKQKDVSHKPGQLFSFKKQQDEQIISSYF